MQGGHQQSSVPADSAEVAVSNNSIMRSKEILRYLFYINVKIIVYNFIKHCWFFVLLDK